jgi:hypothetical protein
MSDSSGIMVSRDMSLDAIPVTPHMVFPSKTSLIIPVLYGSRFWFSIPAVRVLHLPQWRGFRMKSISAKVPFCKD